MTKDYADPAPHIANLRRLLNRRVDSAPKEKLLSARFAEPLVPPPVPKEKPVPTLKVMLTGHRDVDRDAVTAGLQRVITAIEPSSGISGMARGSDLIWAQLLVDHNILFDAYCTCPQQTARWTNVEEVEAFQALLAKAKTVRYEGEVWRKGIEWARNRAMVTAADLAVVVWDGRTTGGTAWTVELIEEIGLPWIHLDPSTRKLSAIRCSLRPRPFTLSL